jgi:hypothetical protein
MKNNINSVILAFVSCQSDDAYEDLKRSQESNAVDAVFYSTMQTKV